MPAFPLPLAETRYSAADEQYFRNSEAAGGEYEPTYAQAAENIRASVKAGDLVLVLGAGTVTEVASMLANE